MRIKEIKDNSLKTLEEKPRVADTRKVHRKKNQTNWLIYGKWNWKE